MSVPPVEFTQAVAIWTALAVMALIAGLRSWDCFGRVGGQPWGPHMPARWGWFVMELPALAILPATYMLAGERQAVTDVLVGLWTAHYAHRTLIWPWIVAKPSNPLPVITCAAGFGFNVVNGLLFSWFLLGVADYPADWFGDVRFIAGAAAMCMGAGLNVWADYHLARLRRMQPGQYVLPYGGAYRCISSPNLAGEMLEWAGFALLSWALPGLAFAIWTVANLAPRALWRRRWYQAQFTAYPGDRRAFIPRLL